MEYLNSLTLKNGKTLIFWKIAIDFWDIFYGGEDKKVDPAIKRVTIHLDKETAASVSKWQVNKKKEISFSSNELIKKLSNLIQSCTQQTERKSFGNVPFDTSCCSTYNLLFLACLLYIEPFVSCWYNHPKDPQKETCGYLNNDKNW